MKVKQVSDARKAFQAQLAKNKAEAKSAPTVNKFDARAEKVAKAAKKVAKKVTPKPKKAAPPKPKTTFTSKLDSKRVGAILKANDLGQGPAIVVDYECKVHGPTAHVRIFNKGGHNSTNTCLKCATEMWTGKALA